MSSIKTIIGACLFGALFLELISDDLQQIMKGLDMKPDSGSVRAAATTNSISKSSSKEFDDSSGGGGGDDDDDDNDIPKDLLSSVAATATADASSLSLLPTDSFCVDWEYDTDEWWTHHPEWYNTFNNDTHTCFGRRTDKEAQMYMKIYENQWHNDCDKVYTKVMWCSGWGADFINVVYGLQNAVFDFGRPFAMQVYDDHGWHYAAIKKDGSKATCPKKDLSCYFLPISKCEAQPKSEADLGYPNTKGDHYGRYVPVYNYLTRPQQWLRKAVYDFVKKLDNEIVAPCSVMHVRRADVVLHGKSSRKYYPVSAYVDLLPEDRRKDIFLLTDDQNAIDEAHEFYPDIRWHYIDRPRFRGNEGGWENQTPSNDPKQEVVTILGTFQLAQRCDTFVHGHSVFSDEIFRAMEQTGQHINRLHVDRGVEGAFGEHNKDSHKKLEEELEKKRAEMMNKQSGGGDKKKDDKDKKKDEDKTKDEDEKKEEDKKKEENKTKDEDKKKDEDETKKD